MLSLETTRLSPTLFSNNMPTIIEDDDTGALDKQFQDFLENNPSDLFLNSDVTPHSPLTTFGTENWSPIVSPPTFSKTSPLPSTSLEAEGTQNPIHIKKIIPLKVQTSGSHQFPAIPPSLQNYQQHLSITSRDSKPLPSAKQIAGDTGWTVNQVKWLRVASNYLKKTPQARRSSNLYKYLSFVGEKRRAGEKIDETEFQNKYGICYTATQNVKNAAGFLEEKVELFDEAAQHAPTLKTLPSLKVYQQYLKNLISKKGRRQPSANQIAEAAGWSLNQVKTVQLAYKYSTISESERCGTDLYKYLTFVEEQKKTEGPTDKEEFQKKFNIPNSTAIKVIAAAKLLPQRVKASRPDKRKITHTVRAQQTDQIKRPCRKTSLGREPLPKKASSQFKAKPSQKTSTLRKKAPIKKKIEEVTLPQFLTYLQKYMRENRQFPTQSVSAQDLDTTNAKLKKYYSFASYPDGRLVISQANEKLRLGEDPDRVFETFCTFYTQSERIHTFYSKLRPEHVKINFSP